MDLLYNTGDELSIDDIAQKTSITHADIMNTYEPFLAAMAVCLTLFVSSDVRLCNCLNITKGSISFAYPKL